MQVPFGAAGWLVLSTSLLCLVAVKGKFITCACTTDHCKVQRTNRCNTTSMCYTQFLQKSDGSDPITRGCINTKTPLLCENRRPAVLSAKWPLLVCCSSNLCNQDSLPTPPLWTQGHSSGHGHRTASADTDTGSLTSRPPAGSVEQRVNTMASNATRRLSKDDGSSAQGTLSPIYIVVVVVGVCCLGAIAVVALTVLRRQARLFDVRYAQRTSYLKGHRQTTSDDAELSVPLPSGGTYDNKMAVSS